MNLLFICNQGKHRSKTAECLFKREFETDSAGLYSDRPVTAKQIGWADTVFVMEEFQKQEVVKRFPELCMQKRVLTMGVSDEFRFNQPELVSLLQRKMNELVQ